MARDLQPVCNQDGTARAGIRTVARGRLSRSQNRRLPIDSPVVLVDLDSALVELRPSGRPRPDLVLRPHAREGLIRLREGAQVVVLVDPAAREQLLPHQPDVREAFARRGVKGALARVPTISCPHIRGEACACRKPGLGLIERVRTELGLDLAGAWILGGDPDIHAGRTLGISTVRIGPPPAGPSGPAPTADYEARDLLDAANWVLLREALPAA